MGSTQRDTAGSPAAAKTSRAATKRTRAAKADPASADPATKAEPFQRIATQRDKVKTLRRQLNAARTKLEDDIAECASDKPGAVDWFDYPGVLTRAEAMAAGGLASGVALHRVMTAYRVRLETKPARERKAKGMKA